MSSAAKLNNPSQSERGALRPVARQHLGPASLPGHSCHDLHPRLIAPDRLTARRFCQTLHLRRGTPALSRFLVPSSKASGRRRLQRRQLQVWALTVAVERAGGNSRCCYAGINIAAPVEYVWNALTDYERLGDFIPGLADNQCLSRHATGARLFQAGEQDVALGAKFRAEVVLDIQEYITGLPVDMREIALTGVAEGRFPCPRGLAKEAARDLTFKLVEGDFQEFLGVWRMQQRKLSTVSTYLSYSLYVKPQIWLPVRLIQGRIQGEISANLSAVRRHSESVWHAGQSRSRVGARV